MRAFIEVHPTTGTEVILLNVGDIEWVYEFVERRADHPHAVLRLHERNSFEVKETYEQVKTMIAEADGQA